MAFTIAPKAERFIRRMMRFAASQQMAFRLRVKPGGCSGLAAEFDLETPAEEDADLVVVQEIRMLVDRESLQLLEGAVVDFSDSIAQSGFLFHLPGKSQACCSTSAPQPLVSLGGALRAGGR